VQRKKLVSSKYVGDFQEGDVYHHGGLQITPTRNREYINKFKDGLVLCANPELSAYLGYEDPDYSHKLEKYGIEKSALASQGFIFNAGFGLSVHDISFNAIANLSYNDLRFGVPVFEGDIIYGKSEVLGKEFRKNGATNGSVQVKTTIYNHREESVLEYVRQVLVRAESGKTYTKASTLKPQPAKIDMTKTVLPKIYHNLPRRLLGENGRTFEDFKVGDIYHGLFEDAVDFITFSWLQIATLNDAAVHHNPQSNFIGYGGAVKARAEGEISAHLLLSYHLGMESGSHDAPTYPADMVKLMFADGKEGPHEKIRSRFEVVDTTEVEGRNDIGIVTIKLIGEKYVTDGGVKALEAAKFGGIDQIFQEKGKNFLKVLTLEQVLAVPTKAAFKS
jgi:2-methylfumaryl-CoA hydratase